MRPAILLSLVALSATAHADRLDLDGTCPGPVTVEGARFTPGSRVALVRGTGLGTAVVPAGPCAGTPLDLDSPSLLRIVTADPSGAFSFGGNVPAAACGAHLQAVDLTSCRAGEVIQIVEQATCTIDFDGPCPDVSPACGVRITGDGACATDPYGTCHDDGTDAWEIPTGGTVRLEFAEPINDWTYFLAGAGGALPTIETFDADGVRITRSTQGFVCDTGAVPGTYADPYRPVAAITIESAGTGETWLDGFTLNP